MAEKLAEAGPQGHTAQDLRYHLPREQQKHLESMGAFSKESIERAEHRQRGCQVFDAASAFQTIMPRALKWLAGRDPEPQVPADFPGPDVVSLRQP
jgi:hypothetical protein